MSRERAFSWMSGWVLVSLVAAGCLADAPRDNPLDPLSGGFEDVGDIEVQVTRFYAPFVGVDDADVMLTHITDGSRQAAVAARTGPSGSFRASGLATGRYRVTAGKALFAASVDTADVGLAATTQVTLRLGALPIVDSYSLRSIHTGRWFLDDIFEIEVVANVNDLDGFSDVAVAWLDIPSLATADTLLVTQTPGRFTKIATAATLGVPNLHDLLGKQLFIGSVDRAGLESVFGPLQIVRIIDETPNTQGPQGSVVLTDTTPQLVWEQARHPFTHTYTLQVIRVEANVEIPTFDVGDIPSSATSHVLSEPLAPGSYYWTISVVDAFGNTSRSKEAAFQIQ